MLAQGLANHFKPFGVLTMSVRNNCPWHRSNFTPCKFPFNMKKKAYGSPTLANRLSTPAGRIIIMRRILEDKHFLGWNYQTKAPDKRLSYPL